MGDEEKKDQNFSDLKWYKKITVHDFIIFGIVLAGFFGFLVPQISSDTLKLSDVNKIKKEEFKENLNIQFYTASAALIPLILLFYFALREKNFERGKQSETIKIEKLVVYISFLAYAGVLFYFSNLDYDNTVNGFNWTSSFGNTIGIILSITSIFGIYEAYTHKHLGTQVLDGKHINLKHWKGVGLLEKIIIGMSIAFLIFFLVYAIWLAPSTRMWPFNDYNRESGPPGTTSGFINTENIVDDADNE